MDTFNFCNSQHIQYDGASVQMGSYQILIPVVKMETKKQAGEKEKKEIMRNEKAA